MCWGVRVSLVAAVYGFAVSGYLHHRQYSSRDSWYALFLASFTCTQLFDAFFWSTKDEDEVDLPCSPITLGNLVDLNAGAWNDFVSRFLLPPALFFQPIVLAMFPSSAFKALRPPYRLLVVAAGTIPMIWGGCTTVWTGPMPVALPTLLWEGVLPPLWLVDCGIALWGVGAALFLRPHTVWIGILAVGGFNLILLRLIDGSIALISKLCFWCLLLSLLFLADPIIHPSRQLHTSRDSPLSSKSLAKSASTSEMDAALLDA